MVNFCEQIFLFVSHFIIFLAVMDLNQNHLPDNLGFGGEDLCILELDTVHPVKGIR
jgi:hypothetical protein